MALEQPTYRVTQELGSVEIREYSAFSLVVTKVIGDQDLNSASNRGFGRLFQYISGVNSASKKIAMTTPVQQFPTPEGWQIAFVIPKDVVEQNAPKPMGSNMELREIPSGRFAALRYRGFWNHQSFEKQKSRLLEVLAKNNLVPVGEVFSAVYNPPITPPFLRRNEVLVALKP